MSESFATRISSTLTSFADSVSNSVSRKDKRPFTLKDQTTKSLEIATLIISMLVAWIIVANIQEPSKEIELIEYELPDFLKYFTIAYQWVINLFSRFFTLIYNLFFAPIIKFFKFVWGKICLFFSFIWGYIFRFYTFFINIPVFNWIKVRILLPIYNFFISIKGLFVKIFFRIRSIFGKLPILERLKILIDYLLYIPKLIVNFFIFVFYQLVLFLNQIWDFLKFFHINKIVIFFKWLFSYPIKFILGIWNFFLHIYYSIIGFVLYLKVFLNIEWLKFIVMAPINFFISIFLAIWGFILHIWISLCNFLSIQALVDWWNNLCIDDGCCSYLNKQIKELTDEVKELNQKFEKAKVE